jgi:hypothetical protein
MWCAASDSLTLTPEPTTMGVQAPMSEPGEPGGTEADSAVEA